jgi:hypothetical protein
MEQAQPIRASKWLQYTVLYGGAPILIRLLIWLVTIGQSSKNEYAGILFFLKPELWCEYGLVVCIGILFELESLPKDLIGVVQVLPIRIASQLCLIGFAICDAVIGIQDLLKITLDPVGSYIATLLLGVCAFRTARGLFRILSTDYHPSV